MSGNMNLFYRKYLQLYRRGVLSTMLTEVAQSLMMNTSSVNEVLERGQWQGDK